MFYFLRLFPVDLIFFFVKRPRATFCPANFVTGVPDDDEAFAVLRFFLAPCDFGVTIVAFLVPADFGDFFLLFFLPLPDVGVPVSLCTRERFDGGVDLVGLSPLR